MQESISELIRNWVHEGRYIIGLHASERLEERGILEWQVVDGMTRGRCIAERSEASPNPAAEFDLLLADGTAVKAVWSLLRTSRIAKLVTVHYIDEG